MVRKELIFKENYNGFNEFYDANKTTIYKSILELFEEFKNIDNNELTLSLFARIEELDWNTEMIFRRENQNILKREILNYFEEIEEFEICQKIIILHNDLTK